MYLDMSEDVKMSARFWQSGPFSMEIVDIAAVVLHLWGLACNKTKTY